MAGEVVTIYADEQLPASWDASVFIGGTNSGSSDSLWQTEVIKMLRTRWATNGRLVVLLPEPSRGVTNTDELLGRYARAAEIADIVIFWWPDGADPNWMLRNLAVWNDSQRVVHGTPPDRPQTRFLYEYANRHAMSAPSTLADLVSEALNRVGPGALRSGGERDVPLPVWQTDSFQRWYAAQTTAGNTLLSARQVWTFSAGERARSPLYWALHVRVYIQREDRVKTNEVVISRPDISVVALYRRGTDIDDTAVVLVREFRSPASTPDGLVHELPGGSGTGESTALGQAVKETVEETGLAIDIRRIHAHGSRQVAATVSAHHAHLFAAEITSDELAQLRATQSLPHGVNDTERTWTEITTFGEIRENQLVDWATLGMIAEAVLDRTAM